MLNTGVCKNCDVNVFMLEVTFGINSSRVSPQLVI